ncbi:MAG: HD domain-containing protein [Candidatus Paceibacterota bacterium]
MVRLREITQSVLPNCLIHNGPIPSRFQHSMGVCYLAEKVLENYLSEYGHLLPIAALLHDAGNPPFSHLSEPFLKEVTGKDGESFLEDMLDGSETEKILIEMGLSVELVVSWVTGKAPLSDILHGSLDIDNLDNVGRFNHAANLGGPSFGAIGIASGFRLTTEKEWVLPTVFEERVGKWLETRHKVYTSLYQEPHLNIVAMVSRAVEIAFCENEIKRDFFFLNDSQAIEYLLHCNSRTAYLVDRALRWNWYKEAYRFSSITVGPEEKLAKLAQRRQSGREMAELISRRLGIPEEKISVLIFKGKENRNVTIPFINKEGWKVYSGPTDMPSHRVVAYLPGDLMPEKWAVKELIESEIK